VLYEISKESLPKKPTKALPTKNMVSFKPIKLFQDVASDMGFDSNKSGENIGFESILWHIW
jgi:hypothetical protein